MKNLSDIHSILDDLYDKKLDFIDFNSPFELLIGIILSAQTTDLAVNKILPPLFSKFKDANELSNANIEDIIDIIRTLGFYNTKSKSLKGAGFAIHNVFNDVVPDNMKDLLSIPGVGRKSANVILGRIYNKPAIIVDTHFGRVCRRIGFTANKNPDKVEKDIAQIVDPKIQYRFSQIINKHGRVFCHAKTPLCDSCPIANFCLKII